MPLPDQLTCMLHQEGEDSTGIEGNDNMSPVGSSELAEELRAHVKEANKRLNRKAKADLGRVSPSPESQETRSRMVSGGRTAIPGGDAGDDKAGTEWLRYGSYAEAERRSETLPGSFYQVTRKCGL